jgi:catechol 2,3-dioxygenase-like lactoylglutathione lyase family enzyme
MGYHPVFSQLNLVVRDMDAAVAIYRRPGLPVTVHAGGYHAEATVPNGAVIERDTTEFVPQWDTGWAGGTGGSTVPGFTPPARRAVDEVYADLTGAGYSGRQQPYDAFRAARHAIAGDPDGNPVRLMSPIDAKLRHWPPAPPPPGT